MVMGLMLACPDCEASVSVRDLVFDGPLAERLVLLGTPLVVLALLVGLAHLRPWRSTP
jgi:hypothetical protein